MEIEKTKTVTILLTKYTDLFSRLISLFSGNGYSHASLSINEGDETFYSCSYKGFVIENPKRKKSRKRMKDNVCIRMQVSEASYNIIKQEIDRFLLHREKYKYAKIGILLCLLHIPCKFKNKYFCSQFVAEVLTRAEAVVLKKNESLYLPNHFLDEMECIFPSRQIHVRFLQQDGDTEFQQKSRKDRREPEQTLFRGTGRLFI